MHPLLFSFNDYVEGVRDWLKQMDLSLKRERVFGVECQQGTPDTAEELERMENLHKELHARRYVYSMWVFEAKCYTCHSVGC